VSVLRAAGRNEAAVELANRTLENLGSYPDEEVALRRFAAEALCSLGRAEEAELHLDRAMQLLGALGGGSEHSSPADIEMTRMELEDHPGTNRSSSGEAWALPETCEGIADCLVAARRLGRFGRIAMRRGAFSDALARYQLALELLARALGTSSLPAIGPLAGLVEAEAHLGRAPQAIAAARSAREELAAKLGRHRWPLVRIMSAERLALEKAGRHVDSIMLAREAEEILAKEAGEYHHERLTLLHELRELMDRHRPIGESLPVYLEVARQVHRVPGMHPDQIVKQEVLAGNIAEKADEPEIALSAYRQALGVSGELSRSGRDWRAAAELGFVRTLLRLGRYQEVIDATVELARNEEGELGRIERATLELREAALRAIAGAKGPASRCHPTSMDCKER